MHTKKKLRDTKKNFVELIEQNIYDSNNDIYEVKVKYTMP